MRLNIQDRQMNCSIEVGGLLFIGCRDRRIFVYNNDSLELMKVIEVAESVHCMCTFKDLLVVGMTDGNLLLLDCSVELTVLMEAKFRDIGSIWTVCSCNDDNDLALGTLQGLFIV